MGAIQKVQLDVERVLAILESSRDIEELRVAKGMADVALAAARASSAVRANAQVMALCESADLRFRRALGEILARMPKAEGAKGRGKKADESAVTDADRTSLDDLGISKNESSQCQRLATLPAPVFDAEVRAGVESGKLPTLSGLLKKADEAEVRRLSAGLTPAAREVVAGVALKPRDVRAILDAGAKAEPSKRALAERQVASAVKSRKAQTAATTAPTEASDDIATPKDIADAFLELNDEERAECLARMGCIAIERLSGLRQQRDADDEYHSWRAREADIKTKFGASPPQRKIDFVLAGGELALALLGLDYTATPEKLAEAYRPLALAAHPDRGGNQEVMARLNWARGVVRDFVESKP